MATPTELRVHGVSGLPPSEILHSLPVSFDLSERAAKVYEPMRDEWDVKAYHWGSLTAGKPITALWILLAPFAMANTAGWMLRNRSKLNLLATRIAALALTGLFFAQAADILLAIPHDAGRTGDTTIVPTVLFAVSVALILFVGLISSQSTFGRRRIGERLCLMCEPARDALADKDADGLDFDDPASWAKIGDKVIWRKHPILHRIRRIHLTVGAATISMVATMNGPTLRIQFWASVAVAVAALAALALTSISPKSRLGLSLTVWLPAAGGLLLVAVGVSLATLDMTDPAVTGNLFSGAGATVLAMVLAVTVSSLPILMSGSYAAAGILVAGASIGTSLGIAGSVIVQSYLTTGAVIGSPNFPNPAKQVSAVGMLLWVLLVAALALVFTRIPLTKLGPLGRIYTIHYEDEAREGRVAGESLLRRVFLRSQMILGITAVFAILTSLLGSLLALDDMVNKGAVLNALTFTMPWKLELSGFGLTFDLGSLPGISILLVVIVPAFVMVRSILGGLRNLDTRRRVGILWDLVSFWPRWYHPLGPPAYGPNAVWRLSEELQEKEPDVLVGHSHGSLISAVALSSLDDPAPEIGLITYGSQLGASYPLMFPDVGLDELVENLDNKLAGRWVNLWRRSDSTGGQHVKALGDRNWHVDVGRGHSEYELAADFRLARKAVTDGHWTAPDKST